MLNVKEPDQKQASDFGYAFSDHSLLNLKISRN